MQRKLMGFGLVIATLLASAPATAGTRLRTNDNWFWNYYDQKWCLSAMTQLNECGYATLEQCHVARAGVGGSCNINPRYVERVPRQAPAKRRVYR